MSDIIKAIILGIVEGFTEFLPISSTGHLIIINQFISFEEHFTNMFDVIIQLGAILSVIVYFRNKLFPFDINTRKQEKSEIFTLWKKTIIGVLPALVIGAIFQEYIEKVLFNPFTVSVSLIIGGILIILIENRKQNVRINSIESLDYKTALLIGVIQCVAMIPGTSRSGATIIGGMLLGTSRVVAAEFSFYLAIPTMIAASSYSLLKLGLTLTMNEITILTVGFLVSFLVAWIVIASFMKYISKKDFKPFAYYRIVLGVLLLVYFGF